MTQRQVVDIEKFAASLRNILEVSTPVNVEDVVTRLGGKLNTVPSIEDDREAKIERTGEIFTISVKKSMPENRMKFSIAHEIGHLFLHMGYWIDQDRWDKSEQYTQSVRYRFGYSIEEREANEFAAALLMPKHEFIKVAEKNIEDEFFKLAPIARHFKVSVDAVRVRGRYLGLFSWE